MRLAEGTPTPAESELVVQHQGQQVAVAAGHRCEKVACHAVGPVTDATFRMRPCLRSNMRGKHSRVSAVNARRLGWSPKGPSLAKVVEGHL